MFAKILTHSLLCIYITLSYFLLIYLAFKAKYPQSSATLQHGPVRYYNKPLAAVSTIMLLYYVILCFKCYYFEETLNYLLKLIKT